MGDARSHYAEVARDTPSGLYMRGFFVLEAEKLMRSRPEEDYSLVLVQPGTDDQRSVATIAGAFSDGSGQMELSVLAFVVSEARMGDLEVALKFLKPRVSGFNYAAGRLPRTENVDDDFRIVYNETKEMLASPIVKVKN